MKTNRCLSPGNRIRRGFSLLEVLLALSLGVVLLTAIGVAVDQSWRLTTQGKTELQRQQVARAISRMIERDVRSVMFTPLSEFADDGSSTSSGSSSSNTNGSSSTSGGSNAGNQNNGSGGSGSASSGTSGSTDDGSTSIMMSSSQQGLILASRGIRGDQFTLEIDGSRPQRELSFRMSPDGSTPLPPASDLRTIYYLVAPPGVANDAAGRGGFCRREADRYAVVSTEAQGQQAAVNSPTTLLAAEITSVEFRYFDGTMWQVMWDSQAYGRLPRAIEAVVRFAPPSSHTNVWLNQAVNQSTATVRLVIHIPAADPVPEEI